MRITEFEGILERTYNNVQRKHTLQLAAGLSYYFVMSLFPLLIVFAASVSYLPVPNLFDAALAFAGRFMPHDSVGLVKAVLRQVITPERGKFLSFGILGDFWRILQPHGSFERVLRRTRESPLLENASARHRTDILDWNSPRHRLGAHARGPPLRSLARSKGRSGQGIRHRMAVSALVHRTWHSLCSPWS
jgi:hypothetical protein